MQPDRIFHLLISFFLYYAAAVAWLIYRARRALSPLHRLRRPILWTVAALSLCFPIGRILEAAFPGSPYEWLVRPGAIWLGFFLYAFLGILLADLVLLLHRLTLKVRNRPFQPDPRHKLACLGGIAILALATTAYGIWRATTPAITRLTVEVPGEGTRHELVLVAVSDIHLGALMRNSRTDRMVEAVNALSPDLILLPGDIVDEDLGAVVRKDTGAVLARLRARLGVFACPGNHEYYGGPQESIRYLESHGIHVLRDQAVTVSGLRLAGRDDLGHGFHSAPSLLSLSRILAGTDPSLPLVVLDHQPRRLQEAAAAGACLTLSGHTHGGQLWPFSSLAALLYPQNWGPSRIGTMTAYVSCGYGTWGPPLRIGTIPEIVLIRLQVPERPIVRTSSWTGSTQPLPYRL